MANRSLRLCLVVLLVCRVSTSRPDAAEDRQEAAAPGAPGGGCTPGSISVCVPCIPRDVQALVDRMLPTVANQTLAPCEVVLAVSEISPAEASALEGALRRNFSSLGIKVVGTTDKQAPGQNRNRAAAEARGDILSFMDADDRMHPQRLQILRDVFNELGDGAPPGWGGQQPTPACVLHSFTTTSNSSSHQRFDAATVAKHTSVCSRVCWADTATLGNDLSLLWHDEPVWALPHNGHVTCHRHVMKQVQYDDQHVKEDFAFVQHVRDVFGPRSLGFCALPLTEYMPSAERSHPETLAGSTYLSALARLQG